MTVWLLLRRGRWLSRLLGAWMPSDGRIFTLLRQLGAMSWMACALVFTSACSGTAACALCAKSLSAPGAARKRGYHQLTFDANPGYGVQAIVDDPFDFKPECFLFIELPRITSATALVFFDHTSSLKYNTRGFIFNFLSWPWGGNYGVQADNEMSDTTEVFCSEAITAFVQANGYPMGLTPCCTTPQMLAAGLVDAYPAELATRQYHIDPSAPADAPLAHRLVLVRSTQ